MDEAELLDRMMAELDLDNASDRVVTVPMTVLEAFVVVGQLQLALRHPENAGPTATIAEAAARKLQAVVAPAGSALDLVMTMGWNPEHDR